MSLQPLNLLIGILTLAQCSPTSDHGTTSILYVTPTTNTSCPGTPCLTLSQYADNQNTYFHENKELYFLPGVHELNTQIAVGQEDNVTFFALLGSRFNHTMIITSGQAAFYLLGIQTTRIDSLHFCGSGNLIIRNSKELFSHNLHLTSSNGQGLALESIESIMAINTTLSNSANVSSVVSIMWSNGDFINTSVLNNSGNSVLTINQSSILFKTFTMFTQNIADKSSSLKIEASTVSFDGSTEFISNSCKNKGGSMNVIYSNISLADQIRMSSNNAREGGAIQLDHSVLKLQGLIEMMNNSATQFSIGTKFGGAINSIGSTIIMEGRVSFNSNRVVAGFAMTFGGAISLQKTSLIMSGVIQFCNNSAEGFFSYGGAIILSNSTLTATSVDQKQCRKTWRSNSSNKSG